MPNTKDLTPKYFRCLLYGRTGIGKTTLLGTAPKPLILATEDGLQSLSAQDVSFRTIKTLGDLRKTFSLLVNDKIYETICLDSLTALCDIVLADVERESGSDEARTTYPLLRTKVWNIVAHLLKLPKHVIMTATETGGDGNKPYLPSMIGSKLCEDIGRPFDHVHYMTFGSEDKVVIHVSRHRDSVAKDRTGELGKDPVHYARAYFVDAIETIIGPTMHQSEQEKNPPDPKKAPKKPKPSKPPKEESQPETTNEPEHSDDDIPFDF